jgi:uroporphyrinogen-III synthase
LFHGEWDDRSACLRALMNTSCELHGLRVLVTRPADQAEPLCRLISEAGGEALCLPTLEIQDPDPRNVARLNDVIDNLEIYDLAVFISVNAVSRGMEFIRGRRPWPARVKVATVGASSAQALAGFGLAVDLVPSHQFNSEALLALEELRDMRGKRVVIFRGNGGRDLLRDVLIQRGAVVDYVEVYRRECPEIEPGAIAHFWQPGAVDLITITSNESLQNLYNMAGVQARPLLRNMQLVVISRRQAVLAEELGFRHKPLVAANAGDEAILSVLLGYVSAGGAKLG